MGLLEDTANLSIEKTKQSDHLKSLDELGKNISDLFIKRD